MPDSLYRSHSLEKSLSDEQVITSGSITFWEDTPTSPLDVGDTFTPIPNGPTLTVKKVNISDNVIGLNAGKLVRQWQISVDGVLQEEAALPDNEVSWAYEINGSTVRTVSGELIALRRSKTPITKKTFTVFTDTEDMIITPGDAYQGGIALSENVIKEDIKVDGVVTGCYYRHNIEVEA